MPLGAPATPYAVRRDSLDSASGAGAAMDPNSPSAVPALVFDEEPGYDDDGGSESSSLPSAASELPRGAGPEWGVAGGMNASAGHHGHGSHHGHGGSSHHHGHHGHNRADTDGARSPDLDAEPERESERERERERGSPVTPPGSEERSSPGSGSSPPRAAPAKKSKMHQCAVCFKLFPRPSGLQTHMNSHSGAKRESPAPDFFLFYFYFCDVR